MNGEIWSRSLTRERNYASRSREAAASTTGKGLAEVPAFYATIFLIFCYFSLLLSLSLLLLHQYNRDCAPQHTLPKA